MALIKTFCSRSLKWGRWCFPIGKRNYNTRLIFITFLLTFLMIFRTYTSDKPTYNLKADSVEVSYIVLFDISLSVKAAPHECVIRTGQPQTSIGKS